MLKVLKQMFQKKNVSKEITVKINADTTGLEKALNQVSEQACEIREDLVRAFDDPHIRLVTNDDNVPELYIDGDKKEYVVDIEYHWHTATNKPGLYDIEASYIEDGVICKMGGRHAQS